jgi:hypothetical protein
MKILSLTTVEGNSAGAQEALTKPMPSLSQDGDRRSVGERSNEA